MKWEEGGRKEEGERQQRLRKEGERQQPKERGWETTAPKERGWETTAPKERGREGIRVIVLNWAAGYPSLGAGIYDGEVKTLSTELKI